MDSLRNEILGAACEFNGITGQSCCSPPCLITSVPADPDLVDSPVPANLVAGFNSSASYYLTAPLPGQYVYLSNWQRVVNDPNVGLPNFFTWLDAYSPNPAVPGTIRQGFAQSTSSVNPYVASTAWDLMMVRNVYDSLFRPDPLNSAEQINWMTTTTLQLSNSSLTYTAPAHTQTTYRFTLRSDLYFQDGRSVTSYDVAFSYLSMVGTGAFLGSAASSITGVTVLGPRQFDVGVNSTGSATLPNLTSLPILPGRYWTVAGSSAWDDAVRVCASMVQCGLSQYGLAGSLVNCLIGCSQFPASLLIVNPAYTIPTFDPIANNIFVGSGPWQCGSATSLGGPICSSSGAQNPSLGGSYTLTRFGSGLAPGASGSYFRSNGNLALCLWSNECLHDFTRGFLDVGIVSACYGLPAVPLGGIPSPSSCAHYQQGIGAKGGPTIVGLNQIGIVNRFMSTNWVYPFNWALSPPTGIAPLDGLVLYEGSATLNPASLVGCNVPYPAGGFDC